MGASAVLRHGLAAIHVPHERSGSRRLNVHPARTAGRSCSTLRQLLRNPYVIRMAVNFLGNH